MKNIICLGFGVSHCSRHSPGDPREGGAFKALAFNPKETCAENYVRNFELRVKDYYKRDVTDYRKKQHFFEALFGQQRVDTGCTEIDGTYEEMKEAFINVYRVSRLNTYREVESIKMRENETVVAFANRLKHLLPKGEEVDGGWFKYTFIRKLPAEAKTQAVMEAFEADKNFKELINACTAR